MARIYDEIDDRWAAWIAEQPMFFVATAPLGADGHVNVSPAGGRTAGPPRDRVAEFWWGSRLSCVVVDLRAAPPDQVRELLTEAWRRKAPKRLLQAFDEA